MVLPRASANKGKRSDNDPDLGGLLMAFRRKIVEEMKRDPFIHDLTFSQIEALNLLGVSGTKTMKDIALHLKITPPSATVIVDELRKRGLVERRGDSRDRRVVSIALTRDSKRTFSQIHRRKKSVLEGFLSKLSVRDRRSLGRIIRTLITETK